MITYGKTDIRNRHVRRFQFLFCLEKPSLNDILMRSYKKIIFKLAQKIGCIQMGDTGQFFQCYFSRIA